MCWCVWERLCTVRIVRYCKRSCCELLVEKKGVSIDASEIELKGIVEMSGPASKGLLNELLNESIRLDLWVKS